MLSVYVHCNISNVAKNVIKLLHYCYINVGVFPQISLSIFLLEYLPPVNLSSGRGASPPEEGES